MIDMPDQEQEDLWSILRWLVLLEATPCSPDDVKEEVPNQPENPDLHKIYAERGKMLEWVRANYKHYRQQQKKRVQGQGELF